MTAGTKMLRLVTLSLLAGLIWGCGGGSSSNTATGSEVPESPHPEGWISAHGEVVVAGEMDCTECHGEALDGGEGPACAECHGPDGSTLAGNEALAALEFGQADGKPLIDHIPNFSQNAVIDDTIPFYPFEAHQHGYIAKAKNAYGTIPVGFAFCSDCHTASFTGKTLPTPPFPGPSANCLDCHGNQTPHHQDLDVWASYHHITTNPENTKVCVECHAGGRNSPLDPPTPDLTVSNRCFNGTLCHTGSIVTTPIVSHFEGHWTNHQNSPRACMICHGEDLKGRPGGEAPACFSCHNGEIAPLCTTCHDASAPAPASVSKKKTILLRR
jgi:hypothetical protein